MSSSHKETTTHTTQTSECKSYEGQTRTYYIAADEVEWDYASLVLNQMKAHEFNEDENVFVENSSDRIGSTYIKALYREYTDDTFSELKPRTSEWQHLGTLGQSCMLKYVIQSKLYSKNTESIQSYTSCNPVFYSFSI